MSWLAKGLTDEAKNAAVDQLEGIAAEIGASVGQMAIAWILKNPRVSTVITGASNLGQLRANLLRRRRRAAAHARGRSRESTRSLCRSRPSVSAARR